MSNGWVVPPEWAGDTCFIVGGGPSLKNTPVRHLTDYGRVIVINNSYQLVPHADCLYFCDRKWWLQYSGSVKTTFTGRYIVTMIREFPGVKTLQCTGELGLETDPACIRHGSNSGFQAINLAYHFGAKRIVLLGYDMHVDKDQTHWHRGHDGQTPSGFAGTLNVMLPKFKSLVDPLKEEGVEVINATPNSSLKCWPYLDILRLIKSGWLTYDITRTSDNSSDSDQGRNVSKDDVRQSQESDVQRL